MKEEFGKINKEWAKEIQELEKNQKYYEVKKAEKEAIVKAGIERLTKKWYGRIEIVEYFGLR